MNIASQSFAGAIWTLIDVVANKAIYLAATLILSRLLGPNEFGILGMIMVFFTIGTTFIDSGLSVSIVRSNALTQLEYSTIFYLSFILSLIAYLLAFSIAPLVSSFYDQPILTDLIRVYCLVFFISPFRTIPTAVLVRQMNFRKIAILNIPGNIIGLFVGVFMAYHGFKVWSIVGLFLTTQFVTTAVYFFFSEWKPSLTFSYKYMKIHLDFGYKLMLSAQINTVFENIYNILIGKLYNVQLLGYYERAYTLANYPITVLSLISSKVSLPLFSSVSQDRVRIKSIYRRAMLIAFYITAPIMLGAMAVAKPLIVIVLGDQWGPSAIFFQILCFSYIFFPIHSLSINILTAFGRSDMFLKLELIKKIVFVITIVIGLSFGILGLVLSSVVSSILSLFINTFYSGRIISYNSKQQVFDIFPTLLISVIMSIVVYLTSYLVSGFSSIAQLSLLIPEGLVIFLFLSVVTKNESFFDVVGYLRMGFQKIKI